MKRRQERVRPGLDIDFDLLDADLLRCYIPWGVHWRDGPWPVLLWTEIRDKPSTTGGEVQSVTTQMMRTVDNDGELATSLRLLRLSRYSSYSCLRDLQRRPTGPGEFVIRRPGNSGIIRYVCDLDEAAMPPGLADPDSVAFATEHPGFEACESPDGAQRFTQAQAIHLTVRAMQVLGYDLPGDHGDYWEPIRLDIAEELHARSQRPRVRAVLEAMLNDLSREP